MYPIGAIRENEEIQSEYEAWLRLPMTQTVLAELQHALFVNFGNQALEAATVENLPKYGLLYAQQCGAFWVLKGLKELARKAPTANVPESDYAEELGTARTARRKAGKHGR